MHNNIGFVIQARTQSSRLPNKILLPFYKEECILDIIIKNLKKNFSSQPIVLATSVNPSDSVLKLVADKWNINFYQGSEPDVLQRFIDAAEFFSLQGIIRICSDNPFLDMESIKNLIQTVKDTDFDYCSYFVNSKPSIKTHFGLWTEYITLKALTKVEISTKEMIYHEHVTNYIYEHPAEFKIKWLDAPSFVAGANYRFTVDTGEDFELQKEIFRNLAESSGYDMNKLFELVRSNPDYYLKMQEQIRTNLK